MLCVFAPFWTLLIILVFCLYLCNMYLFALSFSVNTQFVKIKHIPVSYFKCLVFLLLCSSISCNKFCLLCVG